MQTNRKSVLDELQELSLPKGQAGLVWLGQAGFAIRAGSQTVVIDAFLSPHPDRVVPAAFKPAEANRLTAILCTHEHLDHYDADAVKQMAGTSPQAKIIVPAPITKLVIDTGIDPNRVVGMQPDEEVVLGEMTVHAVPACHGVEIADAYNFGHEISEGAFRYLGFIIDCGGTRIYHAGDTITYEGMAEALKCFLIDLALLPINGRCPDREAQGLVGNIDHIEAAELAAQMHADTVVPMHYDMFVGNPGYPEKLVELVRQKYERLNVLVPARFKPFIYAGTTR